MFEPGDEIDRYVIDALIGEGGAARVYRVRHRSLGTVHALKVLAVSTSRARRRALREARSQATLVHPFIVQVQDTFEDNGVLCVLMEHIRGPSLKEFLAVYRPSLPEALTLFRGVADGLAHAHEQGLVHRDIKPGNILLQPEENGLVPKVADFGLVKVLGNEDMTETVTGMMLGTPAYESPEQHRTPRDVDERTDIFALGCVLYELVCGRRAFRGDNVHDLYSAVMSGDYQPVRALSPDAPDALIDSIDAMLEPDRSQRTADVETILRELDLVEIATPGASLPEGMRGRALPAGTRGYEEASKLSSASGTTTSDEDHSGETWLSTHIFAQANPDGALRWRLPLAISAIAFIATLAVAANWQSAGYQPQPHPTADVATGEPRAIAPTHPTPSEAEQPEIPATRPRQPTRPSQPSPEPIPEETDLPPPPEEDTDTPDEFEIDGGIWVAPVPVGSSYAAIVDRLDIANEEPAHPDIVVAIGGAATGKWPEASIVTLGSSGQPGAHSVSTAPDPADVADRLKQLGLTRIGAIYSKTDPWWTAFNRACVAKDMTFVSRVADARYIASALNSLASETQVVVVQPDVLWTPAALTELYGAALSQRLGAYPVVSWSEDHLRRPTPPTIAIRADLDSQLDIAQAAVAALTAGEEPTLPWPRLRMRGRLPVLQEAANITVTRKNKGVFDQLDPN